MTANELKQMDITELKKELIALFKEQFNLRMQHATKQLAQTHNLKIVRNKIAKVQTILHEKSGQAS